MAGEWVERVIGDLGDVVGGSTPSTSDPSNFDGEIPWITPKDLSGPHDRYVRRGERNITKKGLASCSTQLLPANTVLLSSRAPIGYVAIAANPIATNQGFRSIVLKKDYDHEFLYYWLVANVEELERHASGSTFKELSGGSLRKIKLRLPSDQSEQRAIASVLGQLDDKIELNRRMSETIEAMARALFRSWFVDFEPVRAKAEGRPTGLSEETTALFPDSFDDNGAPVGWSLEPLREHLNVLSGGTPSKGDACYWDGDIPWVTPRSMTLSHVFDTEDRVTNGAVGNGTRLAPCGSIMVMVRGMGLHQGVRISQARRDVTFNQDVKALVSKQLDSAFVLYFMLNCQERLLTKVRASGHGTGVLPSDALDSLMIPVPPTDSRQRLFLPFRLFNSRVALSRMEASTLAALRDTLLPKLISGELRIADAENRIAAA